MTMTTTMTTNVVMSLLLLIGAVCSPYTPDIVLEAFVGHIKDRIGEMNGATVS